jgi:hypothetical protein
MGAGKRAAEEEDVAIPPFFLYSARERMDERK